MRYLWQYLLNNHTSSSIAPRGRFARVHSGPVRPKNIVQHSQLCVITWNLPTYEYFITQYDGQLRSGSFLINIKMRKQTNKKTKKRRKKTNRKNETPQNIQMDQTDTRVWDIAQQRKQDTAMYSEVFCDIYALSRGAFCTHVGVFPWSPLH